MRARQVERILSGDEPRDDVSAFIGSLVHDLQDVSRAEVPSSVAAPHLLKMRRAAETDGPAPLLDADEVVLLPVAEERRRPRLAALGVAAAMIVAVGVAAVLAPGGGGGPNRSEGVVRSDAPPRVSVARGRSADLFTTSDTSVSVQRCGILPVSALTVSLANEVAPILPQWPVPCAASAPRVHRTPVDASPGSTGVAADQPLTAVVSGTAPARTTDRQGSAQGSYEKATDIGGGGGETGTRTDTASGRNPSGSGTGSADEPGKAEAKGRDSRSGRGVGNGGRGDGPQSSGHKAKGGKKAGH